jgi:hypothetical protein
MTETSTTQRFALIDLAIAVPSMKVVAVASPMSGKSGSAKLPSARRKRPLPSSVSSATTSDKAEAKLQASEQITRRERLR